MCSYVRRVGPVSRLVGQCGTFANHGSNSVTGMALSLRKCPLRGLLEASQRLLRGPPEASPSPFRSLSEQSQRTLGARRAGEPVFVFGSFVFIIFWINCVGSFCWIILLDHVLGSFLGRQFWGSFCWIILLDHFWGSFCWIIFLDHCFGSFLLDSFVGS